MANEIRKEAEGRSGIKVVKVNQIEQRRKDGVRQLRPANP
jgi:ethanolamine utilization protein EutQ (cupin superfamily)